jgi:hypothetical protein
MKIHHPQKFYKKEMFSYKVDKDIELRSFEPHHAEELNALIEQNFDHIKKWQF